MSKTIFITGSSTGLGRATVLLFAARGWKVIATMRDPSKETELGSLSGVTLLPLDVEGWGESLAFELSTFGIKVKTIAPGGIRTDFATRSLVLTQHPAYADLLSRTMKVFMDPVRRAKGSSAEQIAEVVYEAATDELDRLTYVAGVDAKETYARRLALGIDKFRQAVGQMFLG